MRATSLTAWLLSMLTAAFAVCVSAPAQSQVQVSGTVTLVRTGWNADSFAITLSPNAVHLRPNCSLSLVRKGISKVGVRNRYARIRLSEPYWGKVGWLASAAAKQERANAERAAGALPGSLTRIGTAEGWAERAYRGSVEAQRAADAAGIPRLSPAAEAALGAVAAVGTEQVRGEAWRAVQADKPVAAELERFGAAVEWRFGAEGVRAMLRAEGRAGAVTSASVAPEQRPALDRVAQLTAALKAGERAGVAATQREAEREHQGQRRGLRM